MRIPIIFEDNHLLIVEKPPNILSQGDRTGDMDMVSLLKKDLKIRYNKPGNVYLGLIHRLDRPVGGVMAFAKTSKAAGRLADQLRQKKFTRFYLAIVQGRPSEKGHLVHYLHKNPQTNIVTASREKSKNAKKAICHYEVISTTANLSLVLIQLETGRPHQIRVQMAAIDHPICHDHKYGSNDKITGLPIALWSFGIAFNHPTKRELVSFTCPPPSQQHPWSLFPSGEIRPLAKYLKTGKG